MNVGASIWVTDPKSGWDLGRVHAVHEGKGTLTCQTRSGEIVEKNSDQVYSSLQTEPGLLKHVSDLTKLPALHEPALLQALDERFAGDEIYTSVGAILIAVNPFKRISKLYEGDTKSRWINATKQTPSLAPHVYGVADAAFRAMTLDSQGCNQSLLVSGESGAGKTETTKIALSYLADVSNTSQSDISTRILQANPLLEAFGNAKTNRNDNSSRFGKLIQMKFASSGRHALSGAGVTVYLLEKARVVHQARGERNYHVFYELLKCADLSAYGLSGVKMSQCKYLSASGEFSRSDVEDEEQFRVTQDAMKALGFTEEDARCVFRVVLGVLMLGNVEFSPKLNGEASEISSGTASFVGTAARLLGLEAGASTESSLTRPQKTLSDVLCVRRMSAPGAEGVAETYVKPLTCTQAEEARDALCMGLYERLFAWIVWRVNYSMEWSSSSKKRTDSAVSTTSSSNFRAADEMRTDYEIGVLDIFGFEVFEKNFFEQLCINYANEQLQKQFNDHVFELEQKMYVAEGVDWTFVTFPDNSLTISMIEGKPIGLLALIDEECMYPNGNDKSLASKLYQNLPKVNDRFAATTLHQRDHHFAVKHFAGDVTYTVQGFYRKNKNELRQDAVDLMCASSDFLVRVLLPSDAAEAAGGADAASYFHKRSLELGLDVFAHPGSAEAKAQALLPLPEPTSKAAGSNENGPRRSRARSALQQTTVSSHFKTQLHSALTTIRASQPHYVRCLKPNDKNKPGIFHRVRILDQLRYSGVVEVVKVARAGYPTRFPLKDFVERYARLSAMGLPAVRKLTSHADLMRAAEEICAETRLSRGHEYQVGKTKVFLRSEAHSKLEAAQEQKIRASLLKIQRWWKSFLRTHKKKRAARRIQRAVRGFIVRVNVGPILEKRKEAALMICGQPSFQRWVALVKERVELRNELELAQYENQAYDSSFRIGFWYLFPLLMLSGVPALVRGLFRSHPTVMGLAALSLLSVAAGSILVVDAQNRGLMSRTSGRKSFVNKRKSTATTMKQRASTSTKTSFKSAYMSRSKALSGGSSASPSISSKVSNRFGGKPSPNLNRSPPVHITVNADAVKRFAGLALKRKDAMERARAQATDKLLAGKLHVVSRRGSLMNHQETSSKKLPLTQLGSFRTQTVSPRTSNLEASKLGSPRTSELKTVSSSPRTSELKITSSPRPSDLQTVSPRPSGLGLAERRGSSLPPAMPTRKPSVVVVATPPPQARSVAFEESSPEVTEEDEQHALNREMLRIYLEEQAPDRLSQIDEMLTRYQGYEDQLFEQLTLRDIPKGQPLPGPDLKRAPQTKIGGTLKGEIVAEEEDMTVFDLQHAESVETPAWKRFAEQRKNRMSHRGFFGRQEAGEFDAPKKSRQGTLKGRFSFTAAKAAANETSESESKESSPGVFRKLIRASLKPKV